MTIANANVAVIFSKGLSEQRQAYLCQADAVARELDKLMSVSLRTLGYLGDREADAKLLGAVQRKSNDILALQRQLRALWETPSGEL